MLMYLCFQSLSLTVISLVNCIIMPSPYGREALSSAAFHPSVCLSDDHSEKTVHYGGLL